MKEKSKTKNIVLDPNAILTIALIALLLWLLWPLIQTGPSSVRQSIIEAQDTHVMQEVDTEQTAVQAPEQQHSQQEVTAVPTPTIIPTATAVATATVDPALVNNPMAQALANGEWPRPITPEQYDQCVANPNVNPVCSDYLRDR